MRRTSVLIALMIVSGLCANRALAMLQSHTTAAVLIDNTSPQVRLPGTIYVSQEGADLRDQRHEGSQARAAVGWGLDAAAGARGRIAARDPQI